VWFGWGLSLGGDGGAHRSSISSSGRDSGGMVVDLTDLWWFGFLVVCVGKREMKNIQYS